jgi:NADH-quinone oxidoreductase subunit M
MYKRLVFGAVANDPVAALDDLAARETLFMVVLAICVLFMGIYPAPFTEVLHVSVNDLLAHVAKSKLP